MFRHVKYCHAFADDMLFFADEYFLSRLAAIADLRFRWPATITA